MHAADEIDAPPALKAKLRKLGLSRSDDLVLHLPIRYEDETTLTKIADALSGAPLQFEVRVLDVSIQFRPRRQLVVRAADSTGDLVLRFLNFYASQTRQFEEARDRGKTLRVFGELRVGYFGPEIVHPRYRSVGENEALARALTPIYPTTAGVSQAALRRLIARALGSADLSECLDSAALPPRLPAYADALRLLHAPLPGADETALQTRSHPAWRRVKFDELLAQQLSLRRAYLARRQKGAPALASEGALAERLLASLPFTLTAAQARAVAEIRADLAQTFPMQRLLQGDVGSGKTIVAALAICQAVEAGTQAAFMAPTEILAAQNFLKLKAWFEPLGVQVVWLAGSQKKSEKEASRKQAAGDAQVVVGTHALIREEVDFSRLGLAIIDEQHRFGVAQRLELRKKGERAKGANARNAANDATPPHQLMMSATPIPRTLSMTYYADLDVSVLDELPPGRKPIVTKLVSDARRGEVVERVRAAVSDGRQAYWVCPLIEESEKLELQTALDTYAALSEEFDGLRVGLVHGRQKGGEKDAAMRAFSAGEIDVLVATTVIEVGVDVPNACLMIVEHAERFGLAQLHQLRGRVGRGARDSVCVLLYQSPLSTAARERLKVIFENSDGFVIAREDLRLRGPGEFIGNRQSGVPMLRYADLETDADLVESARMTAEKMLRESPDRVERHLKRWMGSREEMLRA
ncbi:MAG: ATP-dependent DNA helicase RecG [Candidatus Accumulibacter sp.]|jgi:ATP-dependent DNA helicase RecG|nr:ATP-dependent DNA helicase RecG [Accumulibacter sp.]